MNNKKPDLTDARAKLNRARKHRATLEAQVGRYRDRKPYAFATEPTADGSGQDLYFKGSDPPTVWGLTAGDFAHNARSALDNLACGLAIANGTPADDWRGQFPIFIGEDNYRNPRGRRPSFRDTYLQGIPDPQREIIDELQPFKCGDRAELHPLWLLSRFNDFDKHRILHPTALWLGRSGEITWLIPGTSKEIILEMEFEPQSVPMSNGTHFGFLGNPIVGHGNPAAAAAPADAQQIEVEVTADYELDVGFGSRPYRLEDFDDMLAAVTDAIGRFV